MVERFLSQTSFVSQEDYRKNLHIRVPENFNFGYDVVDAYAAEQPGKEALLWTDDQGAEIRFTFADIKRESDRTASYFQSLGIGKGDVVMLILKRRYEFWFSILALHKLGAVVIPATHLLTKKDVVYRCNTAGIKAIVAAGERVITDHIAAAMPESPTTELLVSVGPEVPEGFLDFHAGIEKAAPFVRPERVNANDDVMMMYFTSGTTGEPKMVAHDFTYPLGHITTGLLWHNLHEGSLHLTIADTGWAKAAWGKLYGQWLAGACLFVYDHEKFTPADMLRKIEQYRITSLCAPPTVYRFLIREDLTKYDLSSLEYCTTAGEALNGAVYDTFLRLTGIRLMEGFGQTETTLTLATFPWMKSKPGSMGVPNPQYRIDLVTPDGREIGIQAVPALFAFVGQIQEETHRSAVGFHHKQHTKSSLGSVLERIPGIGETRRKKLLKHFGSVKAIRQADLAQLEAVLPKTAALAVYQHFRTKEEENPCASSQAPPAAGG